MSAVELLVRLLPVDHRARYREELAADLACLGRHGRVTYLLGTATSLLGLRRALHRPRIGLDGHRVRLRCRLGLHHWHTEHTADGKPFRRCDRCGADNDGTDQPYVAGGAYAASAYRVTQ